MGNLHDSVNEQYQSSENLQHQFFKIFWKHFLFTHKGLQKNLC